MLNENVNVCYAILDTTKQESNSEVRDLLLEVNFALDSVITPMVGTSISELLHTTADNTDHTHLVIYASGTYLKKSYAIASYWHEHCKDDWLASGHIMWKPNEQYPWMHEQTIAINIKNWIACGRPELGEHETGFMQLPMCTRSDENIHDDYTPLWLQRTDYGNVDTQKRKPGWNIIASAMQNDMRIVNIPIDIRKEKIYIYPQDDGKNLASAISKLRADPHQPLEMFANDTQQRFVEQMRWVLDSDEKSAIFLFNTGETSVDRYLTPGIVPDNIWTTASGFKSFAEWHFRRASQNCKIHTYDRNNKSLEIWQHIHQNWNGRDYYNFIKEYDPNCDDEETYCWGNILPTETPKNGSLRQLNDLIASFGTEDEFANAWNSFRNLEHHYHQCNIVDDPMSLAAHIEPTKVNFLWLNNIFYFRRNILQYGMNKMRQSLVTLATHINQVAPQSVMHGECTYMYFGERPSVILDQLELYHEPRYHLNKKTYT